MFSHSKIRFLKTAFLVTIHRYVVNYNKKNTYKIIFIFPDCRNKYDTAIEKH